MMNNESEIRLEMTCGACPEQYDAFVDDKQVGYLRLRHGHFRVEFPECGGETVYESDTIGDGIFDDSERELHIRRAVDAIAEKLGVKLTVSELDMDYDLQYANQNSKIMLVILDALKDAQ